MMRCGRWAAVGGAALAVWLAGFAPLPATAQTAAGSPAASSGEAPLGYDLSFVREGSTLALGGAVPDEAARDAVLAAVRAAAPDLSVIDMTGLRPDPPEGFSAAAVHAAGLAARLDPGAVLLSGTALSVEGRARNLADHAAATAALAALPSGVVLRRVALSPPLARPFALTLRRDTDGVTAEGAAASEEARAAILAAVRAALPQAALADRLVVAAGVPDGFDQAAAARFAVTLLARLKEGAVRIEDRRLAVEGKAADRAGYVAVARALAGPLPAGLEPGPAALGLPLVTPYRWFVERDSTGILIQGYAPSEEARAAARSAAVAAFAPRPVRDEQVLADGAPEGFSEAAAAAMKQLALLPKGRVTLEDRRLSVAGEVASERYAAAARTALGPLAPTGFAVELAIAVAPAQSGPAQQAAAPASPAGEDCLARIRGEMAAGGIVFRTGRDTVRPDGIARLRRIAAIMRACPDVRFAVEGHTDSDGVPAQNVDLSQRRALAVVSVLVRQGIAAGRLLAEGHGASRPVAPDDSPANKARNRRIEFAVR